MQRIAYCKQIAVTPGFILMGQSLALGGVEALGLKLRACGSGFPVPISRRMSESTSAIEVCIAGTGSYVPETILTNDELAARVDTSDEWIVTRTGIRERRIAAEGEFTSHMATKAARAPSNKRA
jgi:hypothetical protein